MQTITPPIISAIAAGVIILGQMALMLMTALRRRGTGQAIGDGDAAMLRAIRRHGNYAENAAIFVASLALLEMIGEMRLILIGVAALFMVGRLLHAIGMSQENTVNPGRIAGFATSLIACLAVGVRLLMLGIGHLS